MYPAIEPRASGILALDDGHNMYWEESGNAAGTPVLFLHGGPGAGSTPEHRRFFDPRHYRIVLFDQRGCGRSTPSGAIHANSTQHLIADIERLRRQLGIERWVIFGGSWGSTLALAYGETHPERCLGFILRGIFLGEADEVEWFLYGLRRFFPEAWRAFAEPIPLAERDDLLQAYYRRLIDPDPSVHMPVAQAWAAYEATCSTLRPIGQTLRVPSGPQSSLNLARIEAHYFVNGVFLPPGGLLNALASIRHLPCIIVQGRYDAICPIATADAVARAWPGARYVIVPDAGHSAWEPGILTALLSASDDMRTAVARIAAR